jgi:uncharacterized repeat protein (TIGR01451 family)
MKNSIKIVLLFCCLSVIALFMTSSIFAYGTASGALVTNRAVASGGNFTSVSNGFGTNVQSIIGGNWTATVDITNATSGEVRSNVSYLTNLGNASFNFRLAVDSANSNPLVTAGGPWAFQLYTNGSLYYIGSNNHAAPTGAGSTFFLASGGNKRITFKVTIANGALDRAWRDWRLVATSGDTRQNTNNYLGDNGNWYGGASSGVFTGWGDVVTNSLVWHDTGCVSDTIFRLMVIGPQIQITKSIYSILTTAGNAADNVAIPGATITWRIIVTNAGAGSATILEIRDLVDTANVTFVGGSMTATNRSGPAYTWSTNVAMPYIQWSNSGAATYAGYSKTQFTFKTVIR